jgi:DNA-binding ferritin-like protein
MSDRDPVPYDSDPAALQRALVWLSFASLAANHTRWSVRGTSEHTVQAGLERAANRAREACEDLAQSLRDLDVPPDARPDTIARSMTVPYLHQAWTSPRESLERALRYLSTINTWVTRDRDDLLQRTHDERARIALDRAIANIDDAIQTLRLLPVA